MNPEKEKTFLHCLFITLAIFVPYSQVSQHRFIEFDDGIYAFMNIYIIRGLTWDSLVWAFTNTDTANWHPITWITHLVDRELFGPYPGGYLLMNVAWHTVAACTCYIAFFKCTKNRFFALTVALIFSIHPVNVENVAWASERKSLVDALFWFLGIIAYLEYLDSRKLRFYGIVIITHLLGLMAKPMHVTFPCALVLVHVLYTVSGPTGRMLTFRDSRVVIFSSLKLVWPLLIISAYFSLVTASAQTMAMSSLETHPLSGRIVNVLQSYEKYLYMFYSPGDLAPFYPLFFREQQLTKAIVPILLLLSITALLVFVAKKQGPVALLGWFWFLGTMVPAVGLVQVGGQSHADRYLYIPMIGLSFIFPVLFDSLAIWSKKKLVVARYAWLALTVCALGIATKIQVSYWKDGVTLFQHALAVTGDCVTSVNCLCCAYLRSERYPEAIRYLDSKILIAKNPNNIGKFHSMKAQALMNQGKFEEAAESTRLAIATGRVEALDHWLLANVYFKLDKRELARESLLVANKLLKNLDQTSLINIQIREASIRLEKLLNEPPLSEQNNDGATARSEQSGPAKIGTQPIAAAPASDHPAEK